MTSGSLIDPEQCSTATLILYILPFLILVDWNFYVNLSYHFVVRKHRPPTAYTFIGHVLHIYIQTTNWIECMFYSFGFCWFFMWPRLLGNKGSQQFISLNDQGEGTYFPFRIYCNKWVVVVRLYEVISKHWLCI